MTRGGDPLGSLFARIRTEVDATEVDAAVPPAGSPPPAPVAETPVAPDALPESVPESAPTSAPTSAPEPEPAPTPAPVPVPVGAAVPGAGAEEFPIAATELVEVVAVEPEPRWPVFSVAESTTLDDAALRRRRDAAVGTAVTALAPRVKRLLQDEQNELLDAARRQKGRRDPVEVVPAEATTVAAWTAVFGPAVDEAYGAGRALGGGRTRPAPPGLTAQLVALVAVPLRDRIVAALQEVTRDGPFAGAPERQRAVAGAVGARYREWRSQELDAAVGDVAAWAFARGVFDATPEGMRLRWVPAEEQQCPDADDNALEPTGRGRPFPTGQSCPPAHAGCRCLVVPVPD